MRSLLQKFGRSLTGGAGEAVLSKVVLGASSQAEAGPKQGIVVIEGALSAPEPISARLRLYAPGTESPALDRPLAIGPAAQPFWVGLHGHLLPNGANKVRLEVVDEAGAPLARRTMTLRVRNEGETARLVTESLKASGVPLVVDGACDSTAYDYQDERLAAWFDRPDADAHIGRLEASGKVDAREAGALRQFVQDGFLVLEDVVSTDHLKRLNAALDDAVAKKVDGYEWGASQRIHNLHLHYPAVRELWLHPKVMRMLGLIFGDKARACQSLTYVFGSEQQYHQDTIHLTPFPAGRMCGVWTALEDVQADSGELVVFPGSHRERRVYMHDARVPKVLDEDWREFGEKVVPIWTEMLERGRYRREVYRPKAGTVLIWHENLMHAGSPRRERDLSRRSIVGHYFANGAIVYYDSSGLPGVLHEAD